MRAAAMKCLLLLLLPVAAAYLAQPDDIEERGRLCPEPLVARREGGVAEFVELRIRMSLKFGTLRCKEILKNVVGLVLKNCSFWIYFIIDR